MSTGMCTIFVAVAGSVRSSIMSCQRSTTCASLRSIRCLSVIRWLRCGKPSVMRRSRRRAAPDDRGKRLNNVEALRQGTDAFVLLIHHTGKEEAKGARGHSSRKGAAT